MNLHRALRAAFAAFLTLALAACAGAPTTPDAPDALRVIVLRHAEKSTDDARDPSLTAAGTARAARVAERLADAPLVAVYATGYRRTRDTAAPAAAAHGLPVTPYDPADIAAFTAALHADHRSGVVLVVGHSNTAPATVAALCDCEVAPMGDGEFDRWTEVSLQPGQPARVTTTRY